MLQEAGVFHVRSRKLEGVRRRGLAAAVGKESASPCSSSLSLQGKDSIVVGGEYGIGAALLRYDYNMATLMSRYRQVGSIDVIEAHCISVHLPSMFTGTLHAPERPCADCGRTSTGAAQRIGGATTTSTRRGTPRIRASRSTRWRPSLSSHRGTCPTPSPSGTARGARSTLRGRRAQKAGTTNSCITGPSGVCRGWEERRERG